jgi:hypothetical protein
LTLGETPAAFYIDPARCLCYSQCPWQSH